MDVRWGLLLCIEVDPMYMTIIHDLLDGRWLWKRNCCVCLLYDEVCRSSRSSQRHHRYYLQSSFTEYYKVQSTEYYMYIVGHVQRAIYIYILHMYIVRTCKTRPTSTDIILTVRLVALINDIRGIVTNRATNHAMDGPAHR